jgi:antitoxin HicB
MHAFAYPARFATDDGRIFRTVPSTGASRAEAMDEAVDFIESMLADCVHHGRDVPVPSSARRGEVPVSPSAVTAAQVALYTTMRREKVTPKELAERLRIPLADVRRLTDLAEYPPLELIERALASLGHRLTIALDAAE